jgi:hypothetical protein
MPFMTWELWLARDLVADNPLPWQKSTNFGFWILDFRLGGSLEKQLTSASN